MSLRTMTRCVAVPLGVAAATAALALPGAASAASAAPAPIAAGGGETALTLNAGTVKALTSLGVSVTPIAPGTVRKGVATFPVTGGTIDARTAAGLLAHSGGLQLKAGSTVVRLTSFRIDTRSGKLTARVNGARAQVPVFTLDTKRAAISRPGVDVRVRGVRVALSATGAAALRSAFRTHAITAGLPIGVAQVHVAPKSLKLTGGATKLTVDAGTLTALTSLGVAPGAAPGATLTGATYGFPITGGALNASTFAGKVGHRGGITLTAGATTVTLANFTIDTVKRQLWGSVNGSAPVALLDLDLSAPKVTYAPAQVWIGNVKADLTAGAATALNAAFGTTALTDQTVLGVATLQAKTR